MNWLAIIVIALDLAIAVYVVFWVLPSVGRWIGTPPKQSRPDASEYPEHTLLHDITELHAAVYDFRLAINAEMARVADWLTRRVGK